MDIAACVVNRDSIYNPIAVTLLSPVRPDHSR